MLGRNVSVMSRANRFAPYPHEFKVEAVRLVRENGKSTRDIATDVGLSVVSLNRWLKDPELGGVASSSDLDTEERAELRRLRREVWILREGREILKKPRSSPKEGTKNRKQFTGSFTRRRQVIPSASCVVS